MLDRIAPAGTPDEVAAKLQAYVDAGARHIVISPAAHEDTSRSCASPPRRSCPELHGAGHVNRTARPARPRRRGRGRRQRPRPRPRRRRPRPAARRPRRRPSPASSAATPAAIDADVPWGRVWHRGKRGRRHRRRRRGPRAPAAGADVAFVYGPEALVEGRGLGYDDVGAANPTLVYARCRPSRTATGEVDDYALLVEARAGFCTPARRPPRRARCSSTCGPAPPAPRSCSTTSALALLRRRALTGAGGWAETSLYDGMLATLGCMIGRSERAAPKIESYWAEGSFFPNFLYRCADGELLQIWFGGKGMYAKVIEVLGDEPSEDGYYAEQMNGLLSARAERWRAVFATRAPRGVDRAAAGGRRGLRAGARRRARRSPTRTSPRSAWPSRAGDDGHDDVVARLARSHVVPPLPRPPPTEPPTGDRPRAGRPARGRAGRGLLGLRRRAAGRRGARRPRRRRRQGRAARRARRCAPPPTPSPPASGASAASPSTSPTRRPGPVVERLLRVGRRRAAQLPGRGRRAARHRRRHRRRPQPGRGPLPRQRVRLAPARGRRYPATTRSCRRSPASRWPSAARATTRSPATWIPIDMSGGWVAAAGILAGLYARARTGRGPAGRHQPARRRDAAAQRRVPARRRGRPRAGARCRPDRLRARLPALPVRRRHVAGGRRPRRRRVGARCGRSPTTCRLPYAPLRGGAPDDAAPAGRGGARAAAGQRAGDDLGARACARSACSPRSSTTSTATASAAASSTTRSTASSAGPSPTRPTDWGRFEQIGPLLRCGPDAGGGPSLHLPGVGEHTVEVLTELGLGRRRGRRPASPPGRAPASVP